MQGSGRTFLGGRFTSPTKIQGDVFILKRPQMILDFQEFFFVIVKFSNIMNSKY
jgi:hypothetical protein